MPPSSQVWPAAVPAEPEKAPARGSTLAVLALLSGLAVLLNALPIPLFYGIHVLLGSVPAIYALLLWPRWWGVGIGLLASLQTWGPWGHPWAVVIFTLELLWLWLRRPQASGDPRNNGQVMLLAIGYWLLVGAPLVFLFYGLVMRIDPANVLMVAVKQSFNGVLNTELAFTALVITLLVSITAGRQLQRAVEEGVLDGQQTNQLLIDQLGGDLAYRRIAVDGSEDSSAAALFDRLDSQFSDSGRSQVENRELALLIPRGQGPALHKWVNGYWSYSDQYNRPAGTELVQVVAPARPAVRRLQEQSSQLLALSLAVVVVGALLSSSVGRRFEREFALVLDPRRGDGGGPSDPAQPQVGSQVAPLRLPAVSELRTLARQINQRILEANQLSRALQVSNTDLQRTQLELEHLLTTDPLTGCGNRKALDQRLQEEWHRARRSGEPLSCLCIALDGVDLASSEFGAAAGEALQKAAALALRERLRITDHLFRQSHRQFVVIATGCNASDAQHLGRRLMELWLDPPATSGSGTIRNCGPCHGWGSPAWTSIRIQPRACWSGPKSA